MGSPPTSTLQPGPRPERFPLVWPSKTTYFGRMLSWRWYGWKSSARMVPTGATRILRGRFPGTCETVGQVFKFVWRLLWKMNVVCMPLSPLVSCLSRFVTYLLTFPRILRCTVSKILKKIIVFCCSEQYSLPAILQQMFSLPQLCFFVILYLLFCIYVS